MPIYTVQAPDGRSFDLEGDSPPTEQELESVFASLPAAPRALRPSTQQTLSSQEAQRQAIIQEAQRGGLEKAISGALGIGKAIATPFIGIAQGVGSIPELVAAPERIPATVAESARRTGIDIVQLGQMLSEASRPKSFTEGLFGPAGGIAGTIMRGVGNLRSFTPTEEQIAAELAKQPFQEAIGEERQQIRFEGAEPKAAEGLTQLTEVISPIKGVKSLKAIPSGIKGIGKAVRTAVKPSKATVGVQLEKAAAEEVPEIFTRNPNADKVASTPFEGFANEVKSSFEEAGNKLSELRALSGATLNAGDTLADKILQKAVDLESAGQPRAVVEEMVNRAQDIRGKLTEINSLQEAVTIANRKPNILKPKTTAEGFVDEIISKEGGSLINKELEAVGGPEGAAARKKWANLKLLNDNVQERLNKIINSAPKDTPPAIIDALSTAQGAAGVFALLNGYIAAAPGVIASGIKSWAKREAQALKNSDEIIRRKYEELRAKPPKTP